MLLSGFSILESTDSKSSERRPARLDSLQETDQERRALDLQLIAGHLKN